MFWKMYLFAILADHMGVSGDVEQGMKRETVRTDALWKDDMQTMQWKLTKICTILMRSSNNVRFLV